MAGKPPHRNKKQRRPSRKQPRQKHVKPTRAHEQEGPVRLNKFMSQAGVASRRKADEMISKGWVKINGETVSELGTRVQPGDEVEVNGEVITPRDYVYVLLNKPEDTITTTDDEKDRRTVLDLLDVPEKEKQGLFPVGRLDRHTTGVLLLTNDGDLAHRLMHPRYEVTKLYRVRTRDSVKPHELDQLRRGVDLADGAASADRITYVDPQNHHEVGLMIHEGRNRQVRRMFETLGHEVLELERINYAGLTADDVRRGKWRRLQAHEVSRLRNKVNLK